jgi:hypothetical protein
VRKTIFALALLALIAMVPTVRAQPIVDFGVPATSTGTISYGGGSNPLVGTNITVDVVAGKNTALNNLVGLAISNGLLNFTTGPATGTWMFSPGGNISITGGVSSLSLPAGTTLLSGTLVSATVTPVQGSNTLLVALGAFVNSINSAILNFYGISGNPQVGNFNLSFTVAADTTPGGLFNGTIGSGDVQGTVPAPGFLVLLCSGGAASLLGCVWRRGRKIAA